MICFKLAMWCVVCDRDWYGMWGTAGRSLANRGDWCLLSTSPAFLSASRSVTSPRHCLWREPSTLRPDASSFWSVRVGLGQFYHLTQDLRYIGLELRWLRIYFMVFIGPTLSTMDGKFSFYFIISETAILLHPLWSTHLINSSSFYILLVSPSSKIILSYL